MCQLKQQNAMLLKENEMLRTANTVQINSSDHFLLKTMIDTANKNVLREKNGYRHDDTMKAFAAYMKMIGGPLAYETLHANLPLVWPSISTSNRFIHDNKYFAIEGKLRCKELSEYLRERDLPMRVSLSEDATRIQATVCYDPHSNQLVGFSLPLDENGLPIPFSFMARNTKEIGSHFADLDNIISSNAYVQMAQPLSRLYPPFCILLFLTDNTFDSEAVLSRWNHTKTLLAEFGITVDNFASDGDPKLVKVMKAKGQIGVQDLSFFNCKYFSGGSSFKTTYTQDIVHIGTKCRARILKTSRVTPIGERLISTAHLIYLLKNISRDKHLLTSYDIEPKDKQNFESVEKICSDKVQAALLQYVPGSEGTAMFLKALNYTLYSYLDVSMSANERIYRNWYGLFVFRLWRSWLRKCKYTLKESFISSNSYLCMELNAYSLVKQLMKLEQDESYKFMPDLQGSQPCEATFRLARSFATMYSTVVNFNMMEFISRLNKIQLQFDIIKNYSSHIKFPRFEEKQQRVYEETSVLSNDQIMIQIEKARSDASEDLKKLGVDADKENLDFCCQITPTHHNAFNYDYNDDTDDSSDDEDASDAETDDYVECDDVVEDDDTNMAGITGELIMRDYSSSTISLSEEDRFTVVADSTGKEKVVLKSGIVNLLLKDRCKLSSDRLRRVKEKDFVRENGTESNVLETFVSNEEIRIGDWCVFKIKQKIMVGHILSFTYLSGKSLTQREYTKAFAWTQQSDNDVGVLASWYSWNMKGELEIVASSKHKFVSVKC